MTRSAENVPAPQPAEQRWQRSHVLVAGGNRAHAGRSAAEDALLFGRTEQLRTGAVVEDRRSLQRTGPDTTTEAVPIPRGTSGGRPCRCAGAVEQGASGTDTSVRLLLAGTGTVETSRTGPLL